MTAGDIIEGRTNSRRTNKKKFGVTEEQESCSPPCTPMTVQPQLYVPSLTWTQVKLGTYSWLVTTADENLSDVTETK